MVRLELFGMLLVLLGSANLAFAANATSSGYTVGLGTNTTYGNYLINATGWSIYMYTPDKQYSGNSTCYGGCARVWPIFYTSSLVLPPSLKSLNFSTITRTDGSKQLTYLGYPLYYYAGDTKAGDISGQNVGHIWYLMGVSGPIMAPIFQGKPSISTTPPNSTTTVGTISSSNNGGTIGSSRPNTSTSVSHGTTAQTPTGNNSGVVSSLLLYAGIVIVMVLIIVGLWFMLRKKL